MNRCAKCNQEIVWCVNPDTGKRIPLDVSRGAITKFIDNPNRKTTPVLYRIVPVGGDHGKNVNNAIRIDVWQDWHLSPAGTVGINHFQTCTDPAHFNRSKK
jgi:hypothetical protein